VRRRHTTVDAGALLARLGLDPDAAADQDHALPVRPRPVSARARVDRRLPLAAVALVGVVVAGAAFAHAVGGGAAPAPVRELPRATTTAPPTTLECCDDAVAAEGNVVTIDGRRWEVGAPGDVVLVGDWECRGRETAAVFRPSTGEVFRFDAWADTTVVPTATVTGARAAKALDVDGDHCPELVVERRVGAPSVVRLTSAGAPPRSPATDPRP
jgi:hypothetical protein